MTKWEFQVTIHHFHPTVYTKTTDILNEKFYLLNGTSRPACTFLITQLHRKKLCFVGKLTYMYHSKHDSRFIVGLQISAVDYVPLPKYLFRRVGGLQSQESK